MKSKLCLPAAAALFVLLSVMSCTVRFESDEPQVTTGNKIDDEVKTTIYEMAAGTSSLCRYWL